MPFQLATFPRGVRSATFAVASFLCAAAAAEDPSARLEALAAQNARLEAQLEEQRKLVEQLAAQLAEMRGATQRHDRVLEELQSASDAPSARSGGGGHAAVRITGEAGLAFFKTGSAGQFPNSEFRVDDAKVAIEAQVWKNAFAFAEFNLLLRENNDEAFHLGELYVDFESVLGGRAVNLRAGRLNVPFGEEYQVRGVLTNPLISHSVSDIWGVDEGVEVYGEVGKFSYVAAVQNGGHSLLRDHSWDKSLAARVGYDPNRWLHLSASAMRTGQLSTSGDALSEVWFSNGFFRALGASGTTKEFSANLYELDAKARWRSGHLAVAAGWVRFDDDDVTADHTRRMNYQSVEWMQRVGERLYGVVRYSGIEAPRGYPLAGFGNAGAFFYNPGAPWTERLRRVSAGFGYRLGPPLVLKFEYSVERGRTVAGADRDDQDFLAAEVGFKF